METMMKNSRHEVFTSNNDVEKIYKPKTNFYCSTNTASPQLLNRQKTSNSLKNLTNVEQIELETTNDIYCFNNKNKNILSRDHMVSPMIKKEVSQVIDYRNSDYGNESDDLPSKSEKKSLSFQNIDKQKNSNKLSNNKTNSTTKLTKDKQNYPANSILNNFGSSSLIATKIACDKNQKSKKTKKSKLKKEKKHSSAVNIHAVENNLMNDIFRTNEMNSTKLNLKIQRHEQHGFKSIIKKPAHSYSSMNNNKSDKPISPEIENLETIRWKFELDDPEEERQRIDLYKQNRRMRYIEQRNKQISLSSNSSSFLPYLYYENVVEPNLAKGEIPEETVTTNRSTAEKKDILETTLTTDQDILNVDRTSSPASIIDTNRELIEKNEQKETCSNVTTDSAISSLSSNSH